ncbi:hypothetical protein MVEN_02428300 [Mycena venus]|uniref:Signal sequence receptor subunit alpha n=1 Tax=Mycena venus TaxID=2733690 RepID=A0A8H6WY84_9AGAR|nr:hypothetical protein MVEN_02428300 [Mycena venus]
MRLNLILGTALSLAALVFSSQVVLEENSPTAEAEVPVSTEPVVVSAAFPESNVFGHVVNGEKNTITLTVENKSGKNVTLISVGGALTTLTYKVPLIDSVKLQVPFTFYSEFKPGDIRLNVWVDHTLEDSTLRVGAYDSIVTVVEPEVSIFDFKMISTYIMTTALLGGLIYLAYKAFAPKRTTRPKRKAEVSAPVGAVTATGAGGYQEEWIPEHHIRKAKTPRKKSGTLTSGDEFSELSAGELSAPEKEKKLEGAPSFLFAVVFVLERASAQATQFPFHAPTDAERSNFVNSPVAIIGAGVSQNFERDALPGGVWHYSEETPTPPPIPNKDPDYEPSESLPPQGSVPPLEMRYTDHNDRQNVVFHSLPARLGISPPTQYYITYWHADLAQAMLVHYFRSAYSFFGMNSNDANAKVSYSMHVELAEKCLDAGENEHVWKLKIHWAGTVFSKELPYQRFLLLAPPKADTAKAWYTSAYKRARQLVRRVAKEKPV